MTETVPATTDDVAFPVARGCPFAEPAEYSQVREQTPISKVRLQGGTEAWWVSQYAEGRAILADRRFSSDRRRDNFPIPGADKQLRERFRRQAPSLIGMDGAEHAAERRALIGEFTVKRLAALQPRIQQIVDGFIDDLLATRQHPVDLVRTLSLPVPSLVICELLGVPYADHDFFQSRTALLISRRTPEPERARAVDELRGYLGELITRKESEPGDDLFSRQIARRREQGALDHPGLVSMAFLLLAAGHETTANMISLGVIGLLNHPEQLAALRADPRRTPMAVEELLRYFTIVETATSRVATEDVEIGGVTIPADDGVIVSGLSANWDPSVFAAPADLDIERGARHHIAFGYGPHQCLGQNLARLELQIVFDTLFRRVPTLRLAVPVDEIKLKSDAPIYGAYELPVTW
ncbi:cytochrome P450 [Actinoplanes sp. NBRC 103695]|uniref:cytochrome P450 n=1 Tax=Actinoplanes sp. NBRC 103695 TaxID=3032202 RepID=UPI0025578FDA|nr:cytochrome P450 [Actinoplanes sp. NBRC 103695]